MKYYDKEIYKISNTINMLIIILIGFTIGFLSSYFIAISLIENSENTIQNQQLESTENKN